jgi:hypothetical protein
VDFFFDGRESFDRFHKSAALRPEVFAALYEVPASQVRHYPVRDLSVLKVSYTRKLPQGGIEERDMHSGQQYVRLLNIELAPETPAPARR